MKNGKPVVGVVGPTGAGKTTLVRGLARLLEVGAYVELPADNPFLEAYYKDIEQGQLPSTVALQSQLWFLEASVKQGLEMAQKNQGGAWDVPPQGHRMYAYLAHEHGIMSDGDFEEYCQEFKRLTKGKEVVDVLVVTTARVDLIVERILGRGRSMEISTPKEYWEKQVEYWENELAKNKGNNEIRLDAGELDWKREDGVAKAWRLISEVIR
jgi:deoxyadenosine/deoxycytidine kinase